MDACIIKSQTVKGFEYPNPSYNDAKALYVINKEAKRFRDWRRDFRCRLKQVLFEHDYPEFTDEEIALMMAHGIENPISFSYGYVDADTYDAYRESFREQDLKYRISEYIYPYTNLCAEERTIIDELDISKSTTAAELKNAGLTDETANDIMEIIEDDIQTEKDLYKYEAELQKHHDFLNEGIFELVDKAALLYDLKSCVLQASPLKPVAYHSVAGTDLIAAYYSFHGFGFHSFVDSDDDFDTSLLDSDTIISEISSENKLATDMTLNEALTILFSYLNLNIDIGDFLNGKTKLISQIVGVEVVTPEFYSRNSHYNHKHYFEDDYDCYDYCDDCCDDCCDDYCDDESEYQ